MVDDLLKEQCCGCGACANVCPKKCIKMVQDKEGFRYPKIEYVNCVKCGLCDKICISKQNYKKEDMVLRTYAAYNLNDNIRKMSSSGGVFTLLSEYIIENDGIVAGVKFDDKFDAVFDFAESKDQLEAFRGSKYVQSDTKDIYAKVEGELKCGKKVLFSGTPCQVNALYSFLRNEYKNLYTVDFICHGVPSPKIWSEYCIAKEKKNKSKINKICFRDKNNGWKNYSVTMQFENMSRSTTIYKKDSYMRGFLSDLYLRPSCYQCKVKGAEKRKADVTIADFWGIENVLPSINDDKGISLILINSKKGEWFFHEIEKEIWFVEVPFEKAIENNPSYRIPAEKNPKRERFFSYSNNNVEKRIIKVLDGGFIKRCVRKIKKKL